MNYDLWRNSPEVRDKMKRVLPGGWLLVLLLLSLSSPLKNLLLEAWINGTGQGAAAEQRISEDERNQALDIPV